MKCGLNRRGASSLAVRVGFAAPPFHLPAGWLPPVLDPFVADHTLRRLSPPLAHTRRNVDARSLARDPAYRFRRDRPACAPEQRQKRFGNETCSRRIEVTISLCALAVYEETLRNYEMQIVFRARHRDIEQGTFLFQFLGGAGAEIGWNASIDDVEDEDRFPLLALC
jgi:hypothetical protein